VVSFYALCNTKELLGALGVGRYTAAALLLLQFEFPFDNNVQSLTIAPGYKVTLFRDDNFKGQNITLTQSVPCLSAYGFNDDATSLIIEIGGTK
jgi:Beta/Gamma crystallin